MAAVLMIQGTASSVGKSLLTTALCRIFARSGVRVAPFKAQNMALNSAVTPAGLEIGRAQAVQAEAAGVAPQVEMNPVLIKPEGPRRAQIVVEGRPWHSLEAADFYARKQALWDVVARNLDSLRQAYELVLIEGAGSPAEINLKAGDIVNMRVARYAEAPVLLAGDIDRGGVFAQILGTLSLLEPEERELVRGLLINRFRGDLALLQPGIAMLEQRADVPVLGIVPHISNLRIAQEDGVWLDEQPQAGSQQTGIDIAVIRLPQIANFDEFNDLAAEPGVRLRYVEELAQLGWPAAVILPGTKNTIGSRAFLRAQGLDQAIVGLAAAGRAVVGICGGYQLLGRAIADPQGIDGEGGVEGGLGLLPVETTFRPAKTTVQVEAQPAQPLWGLAHDQPLRGYEIHMGETRVDPSAEPLLRLVRRGGRPTNGEDGAVAANGRVIGTYLHGLFENSTWRRAWLRRIGWQEPHGETQSPQSEYDRLADAVANSIDLQQLAALVGIEQQLG